MVVGYRRWRSERIDSLNAASEVIATGNGPVEVSCRGAGPPVVMIHGTPGGHDQGFFAEFLVSAGFSVIAPSRPGYLRTPLATGASWSAQADAIASLLDALEIETAPVYGASGGGPAMIHLAARHPDRVRALVLECAVSGPLSVNVPAFLLRLLTSTLAGWVQLHLFERFPRPLLRGLLSQESTLSKADRKRLADEIAASPSDLDFVRELMLSTTPGDRRKAGLNNDLALFKVADPFPFDGVGCPTLVVHGTADGDVPFEHAERSHREIAGSTLHAVDGGTHLLHLSPHRESVEATQVEFLRQHVTGESG